MREPPPPQLVALLERLGLATADDVGRMAGRVRRLSRDLPRFESVWVDALAQARVLTPFQAAEINAALASRKQRASLRIGPFVLSASLHWPDYASCYRARRLETGEVVRLLVVENPGERPVSYNFSEVLGRLETLAEESGKLRSENLAVVTEAGVDFSDQASVPKELGRRIWAASRWVEGRTAAEWIVHNGRFPPEVVLEIARAMLAGLCDLETAGLCHGDVSTSELVLTDAGSVVLLQPGVRGIVRPEEGYAHADLRPESYDYLPPERITDGGPPSMAGDVYACGCVWWHMLCGRPPLGGGDSLAKLRAGQVGKILDLRRLAPETPAPLAKAVSACLQRDPRRRPESMARLAAMLGPPTRRGGTALGRGPARLLRPATHRISRGTRRISSVRNSRRLHGSLLCAAGLAGGLVVAAAMLWPGRSAWLPSLVGKQDDSIERPQSAAIEPAQRSISGVPVLRDEQVIPARFESDPSVSQIAAHRPPDLVLASGGPLEIEALNLQTGQRVRGEPGKRPLVMVPRAGLVVDEEDVYFEGIDFVYDHSAQTSETDALAAAMVHLHSGRAEFRGCTFRSAGSSRRPQMTSAATSKATPVAIRWTHPADAGDSVLSLPSGRLRLSDCVLRGVAAGVDCHVTGAVAVELANTLHLDAGPMVRLDHCPRPDEPVLIVLSQATLRGSGGLLECRCPGDADQAGEISIRANRCAFVPDSNSALLLLTGPGLPERLLDRIRWTGQGSVVSPETVIAAWRGTDGGQGALDDSGLSIAGVVRSKVGFAGKAESAPAASQIIRWQAPLRSADPPGADVAALPGRGAMADGS